MEPPTLTLDNIIDSFKSRPLRASDFEFVKSIDEGSFGEVSLVVYKPLNFLCVQKELIKSSILKKDKLQHLFEERDLLIKLRGNLDFVQYFGSRDDSDAVYFYYEYCEFGTLKSLKRTRQMHRSIIMSHLVRSLTCLHDLGYIHRDIKAENIFIRGSGSLVLGDFGSFCKIGEKVKYEGTPNYSAPENIQNAPEIESDLFSLGVLMYFLIFNSLPFSGKNDYETFENIQKTENFDGEFISFEEREILENLLSKNLEKRKNILQKNYFKNFSDFSENFKNFIKFSPEIFPDRKMVFDNNSYVENDEIVLFVTSLKSSFLKKAGRMIFTMNRVILVKNKGEIEFEIAIDGKTELNIMDSCNFSLSRDDKFQIIKTAIPVSGILNEMKRLIEFYQNK